MFENKISKEMLKVIGILEPTKLDQQRFIDRFKIDQMGIGKKMMCFVGLPALRKFLDLKLEGIIDDK